MNDGSSFSCSAKSYRFVYLGHVFFFRRIAPFSLLKSQVRSSRNKQKNGVNSPTTPGRSVRTRRQQQRQYNNDNDNDHNKHNKHKKVSALLLLSPFAPTISTPSHNNTRYAASAYCRSLWSRQGAKSVLPPCRKVGRLSSFYRVVPPPPSFPQERGLPPPPIPCE